MMCLAYDWHGWLAGGVPEMMERFTQEARQAVVRAQEEARLLQHGFIGCEHLLLSLSEGEDSAASAALAAFGLDTEALRQRVVELIGRGDQVLDGDALASLGIDLDTVRSAAEANFGRGALDAGRSHRHRNRLGGRIPLTPRAKKALELSLRAAVGRKDKEITSGHLLLGLINQGNNAALAVLRAEGVKAEALRDEVTKRMAEAA
jgi:ATP-dependent Clp protease ATP-binding subunit ClpA